MFDDADGKWHHVGASEPGPFDETWFTGKAAQAEAGGIHAVYAVSYKPTAQFCPLVWLPANDTVYGEDVTERCCSLARRCEMLR